MAAATLHARDGGAAMHSDDVVHLCDATADELGVYGHDRAELLAAAQLHDIGKVGIPPAILEKPTPLDEQEWTVIRQHTVAGERIIQSVPELDEVARLVRHSHERWDGGGYPDGLSGAEIPLASRIVFCADAFHAIRSDRPYRRGRTARAALDEVKRNAGSQFDPEVVDALVKSAGEMRNSVRAGAKGLGKTLRSRRLVSLLLTLAMGGSALAAGGSYLGGDEGAAAGKKSVSALSSASDAGSDSSAPKQASSATVNRTKRSAAGLPAAAPRTRALDAQTGSSARSKHRAARTSAAGALGLLPAVPRRHGAARTAAPGRSGEAPRRPAQPGKPVGGAPGRSEEAPGRPSQPDQPVRQPVKPQTEPVNASPRRASP